MFRPRAGFDAPEKTAPDGLKKFRGRAPKSADSTFPRVSRPLFFQGNFLKGG
jgi:hypothetical protein